MELRDKIIIGIVLIFCATISGSVFFNFVVVPQRVQEEKISKDFSDRIKKSLADTTLDVCKEYADKNFRSDWDLNCETFGADGFKGSGCALPHLLTVNLEKEKEKALDECYREYSFKIK